MSSELVDVRLLGATDGAFCAVRGDGSVVAWGLASHGGDALAVRGLRVRSVVGNKGQGVGPGPGV